MIRYRYIAMALIAGALASCEPTTEDAPELSANLTVEDLQSRVTLIQTTANQNKFTYETSPTLTVQVLDQDGNILSYGTKGEITGIPPLSALTVRTINQDGSIVSFTNEYTITEYVDVPEIYQHLFGPDYTQRTWVWDTEASNGVWGNGGYMSDSGPSWWIITSDLLDEQAIAKGYADDTIEKGWMTFTLAGKKVEMSRGENGTISWDLTAIAKEGWDIGTLTFSGTIPLLGVQPNAGDAKEYNYHILSTDDDHLYLCAPESGASEGGTAWFWNFKVQE